MGQLTEKPVYKGINTTRLGTVFDIVRIALSALLASAFSISIAAQLGSWVAVWISFIIPHLLIISFCGFGVFVYIQRFTLDSHIKRILARRIYHDQLPNNENFNTYIKKSFIQDELPEDKSKEIVKIKTINDQALIGSVPVDTSPFNEVANYRLFDVTVNVYEPRRTEHKSHSIYSTVCEIKLRKAVPNLVFDSKIARKEQFERVLLTAQKIPLLSEFEKYFTAYSPKYHKLEALSFITPEVLEAMISLKDSDIEFVGDSLFCFGPLFNKSQLVDFRQRCLNLHAKVNNNLPLYNFNKEPVSSLNKRLLKNPWRRLWPAGTGFAGGVILIGLTILPLFLQGGDLSSSIYAGSITYVVFGAILLGSGIYQVRMMILEHRHNRRTEEEFLQNRV